MTAISELLGFARDLADLSRAVAMHWFRAPLQVDDKDDRTPVTRADREIEALLRERITRRFPTHGILGEEHGGERLDAEFLWVLDPIDGTKAFSTGNPLFGTLIGLMQRGVPVLGVLDVPALGERYSAARELGAWRDGVALHVREERPLDRAVVYCTTPEPFAGDRGFDVLRRRVRYTCYGGDCFAYALVAAGGADLVVDRGLKPYDWCALVPILQSAGGAMCDVDGRALTLGSEGAVIAATGVALMRAAGDLLRS
ncbi:MAG: inositol monophosphatase family protein [Planctomycetota bacterium]